MGEGVNDGHCQSPDNRRIENRREDLTEIWESEEWKIAESDGIKKNPRCYYCRDPTRVPHHDDYEVYGRPEYILMEGVLWLCNICHSGKHSGKFQCPICKRITSKTEGEVCFTCLTDSDRDRIKRAEGDRNHSRNEYNRKRYRSTHSKKYIDKKTGKWVTHGRTEHI